MKTLISKDNYSRMESVPRPIIKPNLLVKPRPILKPNLLVKPRKLNLAPDVTLKPDKPKITSKIVMKPGILSPKITINSDTLLIDISDDNKVTPGNQSNKKLFICDMCGTPLAHRENLIRHKRSVHEKRRFECDYIDKNGKQCTKDYGDQVTLDDHINSKHLSDCEKTWYCCDIDDFSQSSMVLL